MYLYSAFVFNFHLPAACLHIAIGTGLILLLLMGRENLCCNTVWITAGWYTIREYTFNQDNHSIGNLRQWLWLLPNTAAKCDIALEVWKLWGGGAVVISPGMWRLLMQDFVATEIFLQNWGIPVRIVYWQTFFTILVTAVFMCKGSRTTWSLTSIFVTMLNLVKKINTSRKMSVRICYCVCTHTCFDPHWNIAFLCTKNSSFTGEGLFIWCIFLILTLFSFVGCK